MSATVAPEDRAPRAGRDARPARDGAEPGERPPRRRWRVVVGLTTILVALGTVLSAPVWGPNALGRLAFFRIRRVEVDGARYAPAAELVSRLGVDTTLSVWIDLEPLERRLRTHPLVADVRVERRLPGTLHVVVTEKQPVALAAERDGFAVYDSAGVRLPIDPSRVGGIDAPVIAARDTSLLRLLAALRSDAPRLFARVSAVRRVARDEIVLSLASSPAPGVDAVRGTVKVRAMADVTAGRLGDLVPVEDDLARRRARVAELDLRYRDQVIARLQ